MTSRERDEALAYYENKIKNARMAMQNNFHTQLQEEFIFMSQRAIEALKAFEVSDG